MLMQIPYNAFSAIVFAVYVISLYIIDGTVPLATLTDYKAIMLVFLSSGLNFAGQTINCYSSQKANPALVTLLCQV